ncbi:oligosaccharyltransferase complex subunit epsilon [Orbilia oligospora]|uniref:Dolichyl-diphosphooligosaccharide--protein glycosyltransferase subunit OST2 n=1 Tax=Orbilia oligospora TaxID=2813651 RepID=A0A7C8KG55_ORBOL|nr:oligosaccharyltransferase complex subunit epsilon [Orbilia oligospora]KAF3191756.1 oligosaccharyltransferase complex subunit epsilon [Orbilia oligospora]KAF3250658.1 oligosaccharyltransferase complex subunit epsilon [Orbilia oligospora]KAF3266842.1 oligosaccharyltransferase complex subunit epsilon [Orbilia oligospora]KAF3297302.1 oligosaccharyltransferase complex subunit epsilon [Orbilia oligospora]
MARKASSNAAARAATPEPSAVRPTTPNTSVEATPKASATTTTSSSSSSSTSTVNLPANSSPFAVAGAIWQKYQKDTPQRTKLIDVFLGFLVIVGALQFVYCVVAGNYPFNAFLAGFAATVGQFVLTASLRIQTNPANKTEFSSVSPERAFADFVFGSLTLHFFCVNFIN